jgi:polysaccharide biosynthesis/export protein
MTSARAALACLGALAAGLARSVHADDMAAPAAVDAAYIVQAGDVLQVAVWKEQELQAEVLVRPDGGLSFPLVGDVQAAGHSVDELRKLLQSRLSKFVPDPVVTVAVKATSGSRIFVVGKVNRPGDFPLSRPIDVMQALSLAGGTTAYADVNDIRVLRREGGRQQVFNFRYDEVRRGRDLAQNILLRSGDTVVVP